MRWYAAWSTHTRAPARQPTGSHTRAVCVCAVWPPRAALKETLCGGVCTLTLTLTLRSAEGAGGGLRDSGRAARSHSPLPAAAAVPATSVPQLRPEAHGWPSGLQSRAWAAALWP